MISIDEANKQMEYLQQQLDKQNRVLFWIKVLGGVVFEYNILQDFCFNNSITIQDIDNFIKEEHPEKLSSAEVIGRMLGSNE